MEKTRNNIGQIAGMREVADKNEVTEAELDTRLQRTAEAKELKTKDPRERERDSEMTESDSDEDSLFGDADFDPSDFKTPDKEGDSGPVVLDGESLIKRRLKHIHDLYKVYKVEYWGLLEELRTRHQRFLHKQAEAGSVGAKSVPASGEKNNGKPGDQTVSHLREELKRKRAAPGEDAIMEAQPPAATRGGAAAAQPHQQEEGERSDTRAADGAQTANPFEPFTSASIGDTAEAPLLFGDEARGYGSEDDPATFSDVEAHVVETQASGAAASKQAIQGWRTKYRRQLDHIDRLEQVDIDLATEGDARKVSRHQAHLSLQPDGSFRLRNVGRRTLLVNNHQVDQGQFAELGHLSLIEVGGVRLLFMVNHAAVKRAVKRTAQLRA